MYLLQCMANLIDRLVEWQPAQKRVWQQVIKLASGEIPSLELKGTTYYAPREGIGFPKDTLAAVKWAARVYSLSGGMWGKQGSLRKNILLTGNLTERVAERYRMNLAKALGETVQKNMTRYRDAPNHDWSKCASCDHWAATESPCEKQAYQGQCLRHQFETISNGWCPVYSKPQRHS